MLLQTLKKRRNGKTFLDSPVDGECPRCGSPSLIEYVDYEVICGCLGCGWKENESIDRSIQKAFDKLKRTLERISAS